MAEELTPEQEERVRRLLAEARHDEPIPTDVAARLDRALDEEAGRRSTAAEPDRDRRSGSVARLADRRRNAGRLLLAAAVVVVGGVAVGQVVGDQGETGGSSAESDATSADSGQGRDLPAPQRAESGGEQSGTAAQDAQPGAVADSLVTLSKAPPQPLRSDRFAADAARLRAVATGRRSTAYFSGGDRAAAGNDAGEEICSPGAWGGGRYVRVQVDRDAGWLVYRPPRGKTEVVDLFLCGEDDPERSTTIPLR